MPNDPRFFSPAQKQAIELVTGETGQADHILPYSLGGKTSVENAQLISPKMNRTKGANVFEPRAWQQEFKEAFDAMPQGQRDFLLVAVPGGGKTKASLHAFHAWKRAGHDRICLIVTPSSNLVEQWADDAAKTFGLELQTSDLGAGKGFKENFQGGACTYQWLVNNQQWVRVLLHSRPVFVILDEIHHCGSENNWGDAVRSACHAAKIRLLLSGTAWRSDRTRIPFVEYDSDGRVRPSFEYGPVEALTDGVIREVTFVPSKAEVVEAVSGEVFTFNKEQTDEEAEGMLTRLLWDAGDFCEKELRQAHEQLMTTRSEGHADAAGLVVCLNQEHAQKIATLLARVTGTQPVVVVSSDDNAANKIKDFRASKQPWIVSVRMVSEGTDIKRLMVLVLLTNIATELHFRQVVGRIQRRRGEGDVLAHVFMPAHPAFIRYSTTMRDEQLLADEPEEPRDPIDGPKEPREPREPGVWIGIHKGTDGQIIGSDHLNQEQAQQVKARAQKYGIPVTTMYKIMQDLEREHGPEELEPHAAADDEGMRLEERMDKLRERINKLANAVALKRAKATGSKADFSSIHMEWQSRFRCSQSQMSWDQLQQKLNAIREELRRP